MEPRPADLSLSEVLDRHRAALGGETVLRQTSLNRYSGRLTGPEEHLKTETIDESTMRVRTDDAIPVLPS